MYFCVCLCRYYLAKDKGNVLVFYYNLDQHIFVLHLPIVGMRVQCSNDIYVYYVLQATTLIWINKHTLDLQ